MKACKAGDVGKAKLLLDVTRVPVDEKDKYGDTALMEASRNRRTEVMKLLLDAMLDKDASLFKKDRRGRTLLMEASSCGYTEMVKRLLDKGALVDAKDDRSGRTSLMFASVRGYKDVVELLLEKGAQVDQKDGNGWTALMYASQVRKTHR